MRFLLIAVCAGVCGFVPIVHGAAPLHAKAVIQPCDPQVIAYRKELASENARGLSSLDSLRHALESAVLSRDVNRVSELLHRWKATESPLDVAEAMQIGLVDAAWEGDPPIVEILLDAGAKPDLWTMRTLGNPAIVDAASCGHLGVIRLLVRHGSSVGARTDFSGYSATGNAFEAAMITGHYKVAEWLLDHGFDICIEKRIGKLGKMKHAALRYGMPGSFAQRLQCDAPDAKGQ